MTDERRRWLIANDAYHCWNCAEWDGYMHRCYVASDVRTGAMECGPRGWCEKLRPVWVPPQEASQR